VKAPGFDPAFTLLEHKARIPIMHNNDKYLIFIALLLFIMIVDKLDNSYKSILFSFRLLSNII
jgi:hypothetical protein